MFFYILVVYCPPAPEVENAVSNSSNMKAEFATEVHYACADGLRFLNGHTNMSSYCQATGEWTEVDSSCTGISHDLEKESL